MKVFGKGNESKRLTKKAHCAFFFFFLLRKKPKFIVILNGLQYQFLSSCLKQTTREAASAKSSSWISCSVIFVFAFRHERLKSLPSWNWKQTPARRVLGSCTITSAKKRQQRQNEYTKTLEFCDCLEKFLQAFLWIVLILEGGKKLLQNALDWDSQDEHASKTCHRFTLLVLVKDLRWFTKEHLGS